MLLLNRGGIERTGKRGVERNTSGIYIRELNESELPMRYRNLSRQRQKPGFLSLPGDKHRGSLRDILPVLALGIKAAGLM